MSKVFTFSQVYPAYHPKKGLPTYFVNKIWKSFYDMNNGDMRDFLYYMEQYDNHFGVQNINNVHKFEPKHHTIRSGNRWKAGDKFSPRIWSGKPYQSKQIIIAPDVEIVKTYDFEIAKELIYIDGKYGFDTRSPNAARSLAEIAKNDGLSYEDLLAWFRFPKPFHGQIICWSKNVEY